MLPFLCRQCWYKEANHEQAIATIITTSGLAPAAMDTVLLLFAGLGSTHPPKV